MEQIQELKWREEGWEDSQGYTDYTTYFIKYISALNCIESEL